MTYQKSMSMKRCVIFLLNFIISLCAFAQGSIWTEDFNKANASAPKEGKYLLLYTHDGKGFSGRVSAGKIVSDLKFNTYLKDNFVCVSMPYKMDKDVAISICGNSNFRKVQQKLFETLLKPESYLMTIVNPKNMGEQKRFTPAAFTNASEAIEALESLKKTVSGSAINVLDDLKKPVAGATVNPKIEWMQDIDAVFKKAVQEDKLVLCFANPVFPKKTYFSDKQFEDYVKDKFILLFIPMTSQMVDRKWKPIALSEEFKKEHLEFIEKYRAQYATSIINPFDNKLERLERFSSNYRDIDKFLAALEKTRQIALGNPNVKKYSPENVDENDLELDENGFTNKWGTARDYAKKNKRCLLMIPESVADKQILKDNFIKEKCLVSKYSPIHNNCDAAFVFHWKSFKYIPLKIDNNFISDLKSEMQELDDPQYPRCSEDESAPLMTGNFTENFDSAVKTARLRENVILIFAHYVPMETLTEQKNALIATNMLCLNIPLVQLECLGDDTKTYFYLTTEKRLAQVLGYTTFPAHYIYDVERKFRVSFVSFNFNNKEKFLEDVEIALAEFKNPYSEKISSPWGNTSRDEKLSK